MNRLVKAGIWGIVIFGGLMLGAVAGDVGGWGTSAMGAALMAGVFAILLYASGAKDET